jgi:pyrimidine-specific ribonucleoside hydrolase
LGELGFMKARNLSMILIVIFSLSTLCLMRENVRGVFNQNGEEIQVFVDFDAAPDDFRALLYLLVHPSIQVIGIGVSCGVSYVDHGVSNTLRVLEYLGIEDIPVAAGKLTPLIVDHAFPTPWRETSNYSYGVNLPPTSLLPSVLNASELMISLIEDSMENVTIVALGPLTNVAIALSARPSIATKIDRIHLMGGAVNVPGNVGPESGGTILNEVSEWNIWVDPHAADIVFQSGLPIMMVPLDATNQVPVTQEFKDRLESVMSTPEALLVYNWTNPGVYFWDTLTAVALMNPEIVTVETHCIDIVVDVIEHEGQTNSTETGCTNTMVAMDADADAFEDLFIGYINGDLPTTPTEPTLPFGIPGFPLIAIVLGSMLALSVTILFRRQKTKS